MGNRIDHKPVRPRQSHAWLDFGVSGIGPIFLALLAFVLSKNINSITRVFKSEPRSETPRLYQASSQSTALKQLAYAVVYDTEGTWSTLFAEAGRVYRRPALAEYGGAAHSLCAPGQDSIGSFYCMQELKVYIDVPFANRLQQRLGHGEFAQAYVIAHAVGHHVQNLLGTSQPRSALQVGKKDTRKNAALRLELQADCYAGVWMNHSAESRPILAAGDIEAGLNAVSAAGVNLALESSRGYNIPESFQHGTAEQRERWFKAGLQGGRMEDCDTLGARRL